MSWARGSATEAAPNMPKPNDPQKPKSEDATNHEHPQIQEKTQSNQKKTSVTRGSTQKETKSVTKSYLK